MKKEAPPPVAQLYPPEIERWHPCPGFEGLYEVSSYGRIKSIGTGKWRRKPGCILRANPANTGYLKVTLVSIDGRRVDGYLHKLVARAFHGEPSAPGLVVNHKDNVRHNNCASNLEWCTYAENSAHASRIGALASGANHYKAKTVLRQSTDGKVERFETTAMAAKLTPGAYQSRVSMACNGHIQTHAGFQWRFA